MGIISEELNLIRATTDQVAREIYYALCYLELEHPARANLKLALSYLSRSPKDVGLSEHKEYYKRD